MDIYTDNFVKALAPLYANLYKNGVIKSLDSINPEKLRAAVKALVNA